jgi:site-specific recombinase XerD
LCRHRLLSKGLVRDRLKAVGKRTGVKVSPHMLRHIFATQLVNAGCKVTTIQALRLCCKEFWGRITFAPSP